MTVPSIAKSTYTQTDIAELIVSPFIYIRFHAMASAAAEVIDLGGTVTARTITNTVNNDFITPYGLFAPAASGAPFMHIKTSDADWDAVRNVMRLDTGEFVLVLTGIEIIATAVGNENLISAGLTRGGSPADSWAWRSATSGDTWGFRIRSRDGTSNQSAVLSTTNIGGTGLFSLSGQLDLLNNLQTVMIDGDTDKLNSNVIVADGGSYADNQLAYPSLGRVGTPSLDYGVNFFAETRQDSEADTNISNLNLTAENTGIKDILVVKFATRPTDAQIAVILAQHRDNLGSLPEGLIGL